MEEIIMARKTKLEKIAELDKELQTLEALKKKLEAEQREEDRRKRTNRLCERGGFIESVLPETVKLDKAQFQGFIKRTLLTEYGKRELGKLLPSEPEETTENQAFKLKNRLRPSSMTAHLSPAGGGAVLQTAFCPCRVKKRR
jgi:hypothetical protein